MKRWPAADTLATATARPKQRPRSMKRWFESGKRAAERGASIFSCAYSDPARVAAFEAGYRSVKKS